MSLKRYIHHEFLLRTPMLGEIKAKQKWIRYVACWILDILVSHAKELSSFGCLCGVWEDKRSPFSTSFSFGETFFRFVCQVFPPTSVVLGRVEWHDWLNSLEPVLALRSKFLHIWHDDKLPGISFMFLFSCTWHMHAHQKQASDRAAGRWV